MSLLRAVAASAAFMIGGMYCSDPMKPVRARQPAGLRVDALAAASRVGPVVTRLVANKCMDVSGGSTSAGARLLIWPCHGGTNQQFTLRESGASGEIRVHGSMCVDAAGGQGNDGDAIIIWPCHGGSNQQWTLTSDGELRGGNGKCIDVAGGDPADGTRLLLWSCHGQLNQQWDARTASEPPATFVGAADIARCSSSGDEATAALLDNIPGVVFAAGDLAYPDGSSADFANCYEPSWGRHRGRTRPAPGNHEYHTPQAAGYFAYYGAAAGTPGLGYYSYNVGRWHVISLNSNVDVGATSAQIAWLRADLTAHPATCTLAYWHHPRFSSGAQHGNNARMGPFWQTLYEAGADVVLNGHEHVYERFAPQTPAGEADPARGIREFIVGTGGAGLTDFSAAKPNSEVRYNAGDGVLKLELGAADYRWSFIGTDGAVKDAGAAGCH